RMAAAEARGVGARCRDCRAARRSGERRRRGAAAGAANYTVPNHSHTSDELYVWLKGSFTYIAADGAQQDLEAPAYISLPGNTPHAIKCHNEPCVLYVKYGRPFDLHVHPMPAAKSR